MTTATREGERPGRRAGRSEPRPAGARRRLAILGATGSIGRSTVDVIAAQGGAERFEITALTAQSNAALLAEQAIALKARLAVVADERAYPALKQALGGTGVAAAAGAKAAEEAAAEGADWVMAAVAGAAGLPSVLAAARSGADLALANKEALVCAGSLLLEALEDAGGALLPVDSEHNAIFQCLDRAQAHAVERLILTASGGPFRDWPRARMAAVRPEQALRHPNWSMGPKITIDSATMANKGLEVIEAARLFQTPSSRIEVLIHPQSVVHSLVGYADGSVLAQLGQPDMRTPIAYALGWPRRIAAPVAPLDLAAIARLDFEAPDETRFPMLRLAREALETGGSAPALFNAANEVAVAAFLAGGIGFLDIAETVERAMAAATVEPLRDLEAVFAADRLGRVRAEEAMSARRDSARP